MHLIVQVPQVTNQSDYSYSRPCHYGFLLQTDMLRRNITSGKRPGQYLMNPQNALLIHVQET